MTHLPGGPANYTLKLSRPGFGPGLKPLVQRQRDGVTAVAVRHSVPERRWRQRPRRSNFGTRAPAAQLNV
jgi:hypothetical protein